MNKFKIALQLYSVRDLCEKDLQHTIENVAQIGYEGVELAGYYGKDAKEWKRVLDSVGLKVAGAHVGLEALLGDELKRTVEFHKTIDNQNLIIPWLPPERLNSREGCLEVAKILNELSEKLKEEGMRIGYHNHTMEFQLVDGEMPWDIIFKSTKPEVIMQIDTGNAMHAGLRADQVLEFIKRYPGRAVTVHLKEYSFTNDKTILGEGEMKWNDFISLCNDVGGTEWYIIEQESYAYTPIECVRLCFENLKKILEGRSN